MIEITAINRMPNQIFSNDGTITLLGYFISVDFILFNKIACNCEFERKNLEEDEILKDYIENQLTEDFNKTK